MRTLSPLLVSLAALSLAPGALGAQSVMGVVAGRVESRQLRDRKSDSETDTGTLVGAFVNVATPARPLSVLAEAFYAQRGGRFAATGTAGQQAKVRADILGVTVAPTLHAGLGPVALFAYGGPTVEIPVRTRYTAELAVAYRNPAGQVFAVTGGGGLSVTAGVWSVRVEARVVEELSAAYSGDAGDIRHRSTEILVRIGRIVVP